MSTYKPEPYYGSFFAPVLTCLAAILASFIGLTVGDVVLVIGLEKPKSRPGGTTGATGAGKQITKRDNPPCFELSGKWGWSGYETCDVYLSYVRETSIIPDECKQCLYGDAGASLGSL